MKIFKGKFVNFFDAANQKNYGGSHEMYDKCYFCLDQLPKLKKESTASFFVNFGGAGVQKSRPTLLYKLFLAKMFFSTHKS